MNWQVVTFLAIVPAVTQCGHVVYRSFLREKIQSRWFAALGAAVWYHRRDCLRIKLAFMGWGIGIRELDFTGFSGHTALSTAFWLNLLMAAVRACYTSVSFFFGRSVMH